MNSLIERIQGEDPSFDPVALACHTSGVDRDRFAAALDRVTIDGFYGPVSSADWRDQDGREPSTVEQALRVLAKVAECIDDYRETVYGEDEDGEEFEITETLADAEDIRREVFSGVVEIYGHLPW